MEATRPAVASRACADPSASPSLAVVAAAPLFAACGDDDTTSDPPASTTGEPTSSLTVHGTDDLKFDKDSYDAEAGTIDVTYVNDGSVAHTLLIKDVDDFKLSIGSEDEGTVDLEAGDYTLYCDVAGHEAAGMVAELTVS